MNVGLARRRTASVGASLLANPGCSVEHSFREQARFYDVTVRSRLWHAATAWPCMVAPSPYWGEGWDEGLAAVSADHRKTPRLAGALR